MKMISCNIPHRLLKLISALLLLIICALFSCDLGGAMEEALPFNPGEKFIYQVKWWSIPAGEVSFEILPFAKINGTEAYHFVMKTKTNSVADLFYRIRAREDSYVDVNMTHSLLYQKRVISKHPRNVEVTYDWEKLTVTRVNFGETDNPIAIGPGTFDPVALFFVMRMKNLKKGDVLEIPTTDGKVYIVARASVIDRETITVDGKVYDTHVVVPDMEQVGKALARKDKPKVKFWIAAEEKRVPVKIEGQVGVGSFVFELVATAL